MKQYTITSKILSVVLCIALLFSFLSAFAVTTAAEGTTAGSYTWRVRVTVDDNFDSTSDDSDRSYLTIKGSENNGTSAETIVVDQKKIAKNIITDYKDGTNVYLTNVLSGGDIGATETVTSYTTTYFPTYFYMQMYKKGHAGFGNAAFTTYLEVQNASGNWVTLCSDSDKQTGGWGEMHNSASVGNNKPRATNLRFTKTPLSTVTVPVAGEQPVTTEYDAKVYDQYGILWYQEPDCSFDVFRNGVSILNKVIYISPDANSADGTDTTLRLEAVYGTLSQTVNIKLINAQYTYRFEDKDGNEIASGTLKYGQNVPAPATPVWEPDETNHYIFLNWSPAVGKLTGNTTYRPTYQSENHVYFRYVSDKNATCTEDGTKTATCSCGKTHTVADPGSALGHSYTSSVTKEPSCTEEGEMTFTCIRGDHSFTQPIEASGHTYTQTTVEPTCTEQGYVLHTCTKCNDAYKDTFTDALGHNWDSGAVETAPDCTNEGVVQYHCTRCEQTHTEPIVPLGHSFSNWTIRSYASCTEDGEKFATCTRCKEVITETIPAPGHSWGEWNKEKEPDCEQSGKYTRVCSTCQTVDEQIIDPLGHDMVLQVKAPNDGSAGMYYYQCSRNCGKYACCTIDAAGEKQVGEICDSMAELKGETTDIPAPKFNSYYRAESKFNYVNRGAALRIDEKAPEDKQAMRFASSVLLPAGAELVDFGYIYTTSDYFKTLKTFVIGGKNVADFSMVNGHYSTFQTDKGEVKTFNLVINVSKENWSKDFIARPYIIYSFGGETFTIYDQIYTSRSVMYVAQNVLQSPNEMQYVKDYIQNKIFQ